MKSYQKSVLCGKGLRAGLLVIFFFGVLAAVSACGSEDRLLSGLREEGALLEDTIPQQEAEDAARNSTDTGGEKPSEDGKSGDVLPVCPDIYVHVCGAVNSPGVYELPAGSRFYEAVEAAGGFSENASRDYLNMAAPLADGSRLEIPALQEIQAGEEAEKESGNSYYTVTNGEENTPGIVDKTGETVNINTADADRLCSLPGIGEGRAKAIIEYREKQGGFRKKEDIMQVSGIGEKMYERMEAYFTVE